MVDIYKKYGLTKEIAAAKGIRPIEYVAIESPKFAEEASTILPELSNTISKQELVWTLPIEATYEQRRRWNEFLAFREIIQNGMDASHEAVGYDRMVVELKKDKLGTWVKDNGKGITYKAFILGGEEKPCEMRGSYGEGLKISLIWFTTKGYPVYLFTKGAIVFSCYYSMIADALVVVFGESVHDTLGTKALILGYDLPPETYEKMYYKAAKLKPVCKMSYSTRKCPVDMPNTVLYPGGSLYVRDIYVNEIKEMIGKPAWFSYNLWWAELEPNRVMVNSAWNLSKEVGHVLGGCTGIVSMIEDCIREREYGGMKYYELPDDYYETKVEYSIVKQEVRDAVQKLLKNYKITAYSDYGDFDGIGAVSHEGGICLLVPDRMFPLFTNLPRASKFVMESKKEMVEGAVPVDEHRLACYPRARLQVWHLWKDEVREDTKIVVVEGERNFYNDKLNTIFMSKPAVECYEDKHFIHELSHARGYKRYKTAPDLTENFEKALAEVGASIVSFFSAPVRMRAVTRCNEGCIHATPKSAEKFYGGIHAKVYSDWMDPLMEDPAMFLILIKDKLGEWLTTVSRIPHLEPVCEDNYEKAVNGRMDALESIWNKVRFEEITDEAEAKKLLEDAKLITLRENPLERHILGATRLIIYVYDYREDKYKYLRTLE